MDRVRVAYLTVTTCSSNVLDCFAFTQVVLYLTAGASCCTTRGDGTAPKHHATASDHHATASDHHGGVFVDEVTGATYSPKANRLLSFAVPRPHHVTRVHTACIGHAETQDTTTGAFMPVCAVSHTCGNHLDLVLCLFTRASTPATYAAIIGPSQCVCKSSSSAIIPRGSALLPEARETKWVTDFAKSHIAQ